MSVCLHVMTSSHVCRLQEWVRTSHLFDIKKESLLYTTVSVICTCMLSCSCTMYLHALKQL